MTKEFLSSSPVLFTFVTPLLLLYHKTITLYCWPGAGFPPPSLTELRQSIYPDLAGIDGGCRDCGVDSMLRDLSTDRHTAWQLQNGASMQPSDLLDFAILPQILFVISLCLTRLIFIFSFGFLKWENRMTYNNLTWNNKKKLFYCQMQIL